MKCGRKRNMVGNPYFQWSIHLKNDYPKKQRTFLLGNKFISLSQPYDSLLLKSREFIAIKSWCSKKHDQQVRIVSGSSRSNKQIHIIHELFVGNDRAAVVEYKNDIWKKYGPNRKHSHLFFRCSVHNSRQNIVSPPRELWCCYKFDCLTK